MPFILRSGVVLLVFVNIVGVASGAEPRPRGRDAAPAAGEGLLPLIEADISGAAAVDLTSIPEGWVLKPEAATAKTPALRGTFRLAGGNVVQTGNLPPTTRQRTGTIVFTGPPALQALATTHTDDLHGANFGNRFKVLQSRVARLDLRTGQGSAPIDLPPGCEALAASPDGTLILTRCACQGGDEGRVDLFKLPKAAGKAQPVAAWIPGERQAQGGGADAALWAAILSPELVVTLTASGQMAAWEVPACKAAWTLKVAVGFDAPTVSPDRKCMAVNVNGSLIVLDAVKGAPVARLEAGRAAGQLAWHPDGTRLAMAGEHVLVWNLTTGKLLYDFAMPKPTSPMPAGRFGLAWCGDTHLMLSESVLIDLELGMCVWTYAGPYAPPLVFGQGDARYWNCTETYGGSLLALALPHDAAKKAIAALPRDHWAVAPGSRLSLDMHLPDSAKGLVPGVRKRLATMVRAAGYELVEQEQPTKIVLDVQPGAGLEVTYGAGLLGRGNPQKATAPTFDCKLSLVAGGEEVWQFKRNTGGSHPSSILLEKGQTIQQYLDQSNAKSYEWFLNTLPELPRRVARPQQEWGLGASRITPAGPVPAGQ
ncbi:MAG: WD40 repeat domain-containing protein [Tepidisphaerales bacterium]